MQINLIEKYEKSYSIPSLFYYEVHNPCLATISFIMNNLYRDIKSFRGINAKRFLWEGCTTQITISKSDLQNRDWNCLLVIILNLRGMGF